jgi:putative copper export protein
MDIVYVVLRVLHIFAGIFWAGATAAFVYFVAPAAAQTAPEGDKFMMNLTDK